MVINLRLKHFDLIPTNTNQSCGGHSAASLGENYANCADSTHMSGLQKCGKVQNNLENQENVEQIEKDKLKSKMIMVTL